ncbi:unnamed protein product [Rotaria magnacalcarata]|uniref:Uncharacterized protein n=1 Tax=Rotaria magnacalcarata TaxID=392030 RepID=A0A819QFM2_9BILA|nr:unnamed protein product [Rotaria magnacalcarata]CAF4028094.1 unnamed protein product [Rotaria magnacalcarata]
MDKNDNAQAPTGESPAAGAQTSAATGAGTPSTALGTPGFLQSAQQRFDSMGDEAGSFLVGRTTWYNMLKAIQIEPGQFFVMSPYSPV